MVVSASTNQVWTKITIGSYAHVFCHSESDTNGVKVNGSPFQAITLLTERCAQSLKSLNFTHNTQMATHYFSNFFGHLKNLTRLNVNGSVVDDGCFRVIGENCDKLIELDAGDTYISNVGLTYLSFDELMPVMQCLPGLQIYRYYSRVFLLRQLWIINYYVKKFVK